MKFRQLFLAPLLILLAACGSSDKFPYPPQFVTTDDVTPHTIAAPPARGSREYNHEIDSILARQKKLTDVDKAAIAAEDHIRPEMIVMPILGPKYSAENYPALYTLLRHAASDAWRISDTAEDFWKSPRPWYADPRVTLYVNPITRPGYPSGHTTTNTVWAYVLSDLFPQKHDALFARATHIGNDRVLGGAHFPHDVTGGQKLAKAIYTKMQKNPEFQKELAAARAEINSAAAN